MYEGLDVTHNVETSAEILNRWWNLDNNLVFKTNVTENKLKLQTVGRLPTKTEINENIPPQYIKIFNLFVARNLSLSVEGGIATI